MNDAGGMRARETVGNLRGELRRHGRQQRTAAQAGGQRLAVDMLHDDEVQAVVAADVVKHHDVGMVEARGHPRFALKTLAASRFDGPFGRQNLDRHHAIQPGVARTVDFAHATAANHGLDFVHADTSAWSEGHCLT